MRYLFSTKVRVVLIVAVLLAAALAVTASLTGSTPGDLLVKGILTPLRSGGSALTDLAEQIYRYIFN